MSGTNLIEFYDERYAEIDAYLVFLQHLEEAARAGVPRFKGTDAYITPTQKKILSSCLYLQLYNLVEATVVKCLEAVVVAVENAERRPEQLSEELRREWVRSIARTHVGDLGPQKRLEAALELCEQILGQTPIKDFKIEPGGGGNWDDTSIEKVCARVGCGLVVSPKVRQAVKMQVRDELGPLKLVRNRRNGLAHGSLSFVDCSDGVTVAELKAVATAVGDYLRDTASSFVKFIELKVVNNNEVNS
ncbi:MAE_28990/MAE_18760 family HEPN-like nuclease [Tsukamurella soli]|uniref:MAE-28990/MAE-18760-like HEPN domain-containing protein n=1 Tax=Tsukamurella soli TaxID=644556 RepID=A0ABP8KBC1_9ACTN